VSGLLTANAEAVMAVLAGFFAGALLGTLHFGSLWWNVRLYAGSDALAAFGVQTLRFALTAAGLWGLVKIGAPALLASAPGMLVARGVLLQRLGSVS
jgi:F1F0 ATPase subunit 2